MSNALAGAAALRAIVGRLASPWPVIADRLGLMRRNYQTRTRDGAIFELRPGTSDRFSLFEVVVRRDYIDMAILKPGDVVVDIGANIGVFTVLAALAVGPKGRVIAVEPNGETADRLERNLALNGLHNVTVHRAAVTGTSRPVTLHKGDAAIFSSILDDVDGRRTSGQSEIVPGLPLADILTQAGIERVDLLKIDCEGGEYEIFDHAAPELWQRLPQIIMETHEAGGRKPPELAARLRALGYRLTEGDLLYAVRDS